MGEPLRRVFKPAIAGLCLAIAASVATTGPAEAGRAAFVVDATSGAVLHARRADDGEPADMAPTTAQIDAARKGAPPRTGVRRRGKVGGEAFCQRLERAGCAAGVPAVASRRIPPER